MAHAVLPAIGWRNLWRLAALLIAFILAPVVMLILRDRPSTRDGLTYVMLDSPPEHRHRDGGPRLTWRKIIRRKNYWLLVAMFLPVLATFGGVAYNLAPIAASRGFDQANVGLGFGMMLMFLPINNLSPFVIAKVQESTGSYAAALLTFAALVPIGGATSLLMRERRRGEVTAEVTAEQRAMATPTGGKI